MSYSNADFLADQLRAAAPDAEWNASGHDRAQELAAMFIRSGVRDLANLGLVAVTERRQDHAWSEPYEVTELAFVYEYGSTRFRFGFMGTPDRWDRTKFLDPSGAGLLAAWSAVGKGHVNYVVVPRAGGFAVIPVWGSSSDADSIRDTIKVVGSMIVMFALPAAGISAASAVGSAVVPASMAASYPGLTTAIGNVVLSTAFNGGNIKQAAESVALAYVGGAAGSAVGSGVTAATEIKAIGDLANTAVRAFIQGGDVETAVKRTLIQKGLSMEWFNDSAPLETSSAFAPEVANFPAGEQPMTQSYFDPWAFSPSLDTGSVGDWWTAGGSSGYGLDVSVLPVTSFPTAGAQTPASNSFGWGDFRNIVQNVSYAGLAALQLTAAYKAVRGGASPVVTQAQRVQADGSVVTALDSGVIQVRGADGRITTMRPPVGQAQSTVTGNLIVNNGDGTFTLIDQAGVRRILSYTPQAGQTLPSNPLADLGGSLPGWAIPAALGLGALFLMSRRR